jgi:hypothetical protein
MSTNSRLTFTFALAAFLLGCSSGSDDPTPSGPSSGDLVAAFDGDGIVLSDPRRHG